MHVLLTGASSGIGEALAMALARKGATLSLVARRENELARVASAIGSLATVRVFPYDVAQLDCLSDLVRRTEEMSGPVDVLVNNAGVVKVARFTDVQPAEGEWLLAINLLAPLRLIHLVARGMVERRRGYIINVTSVAGLCSAPYSTHYTASKAALSAASEYLRLELASNNVRVLTVYPGPIVTPMGERAAASYEKDVLPRLFWGNVDTLARRVVQAMDANCARLIYPRMYTIAKWFPRLLRWTQFQVAPGPAKR